MRASRLATITELLAELANTLRNEFRDGHEALLVFPTAGPARATFPFWGSFGGAMGVPDTPSGGVEIE